MSVFVIQKPKAGPNGHTYDVSPAQEYGEVNFILDAYYNASSNPANSVTIIERALTTQYNDKVDYMLWAGGDPYALYLTGWLLGQLNLKVRWLRWERLRRPASNDPAAKAAGYYVPVELPAASYQS